METNMAVFPNSASFSASVLSAGKKGVSYINEAQETKNKKI